MDLCQNRDVTCTKCPLYQGVKNICIPTRVYVEATRPDRAILILGEAPGQHEDEEGSPFVGKAGIYLREAYIEYFKLRTKADIYLGNAVRCRPPQNITPTKSQVKACRSYLGMDLAALQTGYKEVIVLAVGAVACQSLGLGSLKKAFGRQGGFTEVEIGEGVHPQKVRVFATYHPIYLSRNPSAGLVVEAHLGLLVGYLEGKSNLGFDPEVPEVAPLPPDLSIKRAAIDIETYGSIVRYGKVDMPLQTQFHPEKSWHWDNVPPDLMVVTVGLSWREGDRIRNGIFQMHKSDHRAALYAWLRKFKKDTEFEMLLGQNLPFDLMYLRYCYPFMKTWLKPWALPIMDLMVTNYLHDEGRPEKSLKHLAPLLGVTKYDRGEGEFRRFKDQDDPDLWKYNCQDTKATLLLQEKLEHMIQSFYGEKTEKLSPFCMKWYSDLLWLVIRMSEEGVCMDIERLLELRERLVARRTRLEKFAVDSWGITLCGKGSDKARREAMSAAVKHLQESSLDYDLGDLKFTEKKSEISYCVENRNLLLSQLDDKADEAKRLRVMGRYQDVTKLLNSYLTPILDGRRKKKDEVDYSTHEIGGIVYPRWFPVPSEFDDGATGGTKQARIVAKGPAVQTFPKCIKSTISCRFMNGSLIWFDYSQIELRMAALLSGDEVMMQEYLGKPDLHTKTAKLIFGNDIVNHPQFKEKYRQGGKTLNFLVLYGGGASKFQETLRRDLGIEYPIDKCQVAIDAFWKRHVGLKKWQDSLVDNAKRKGYTELPLIGQSRLFLGGDRAVESCVTEIVNMPVQACAANVMISAQIRLWDEMEKRGLRSMPSMNVYDASPVEIEEIETDAVLRCMEEVLPNPPYYEALCGVLGRRLPLVYEISSKEGK